MERYKGIVGVRSRGLSVIRMSVEFVGWEFAAEIGFVENNSVENGSVESVFFL